MNFLIKEYSRLMASVVAAAAVFGAMVIVTIQMSDAFATFITGFAG